MAAVACLGGNGPTDVVDVKSALNRPPARPLTPEQRAAAARAACRYPSAG